jgi:hypothetical protein
VRWVCSGHELDAGRFSHAGEFLLISRAVFFTFRVIFALFFNFRHFLEADFLLFDSFSSSRYGILAN